MAPAISAGFAATIFMLIKVVVHMRKNPVKWSIATAPAFFLIAGTICTLSVVYKGSPRLGLNKKPGSYIAGVTVGTGAALAALSAIFFVPFLYARVIKRDGSVRWYHIYMGPFLFKRAPVAVGDEARVPNYAVVQHDEPDDTTSETAVSAGSEYETDAKKPFDHSAKEKSLVAGEAAAQQASYKELQAIAREKMHAKLRQGRGPLGWAMRLLHNNPMGSGEVYEFKNMKIIAKRVPAMIVVGLLYGAHYDIHTAQTGISGTPEGARMATVYEHAPKYANEVEHTYSFVQVLTACTASFAHGTSNLSPLYLYSR